MTFATLNAAEVELHLWSAVLPGKPDLWVLHRPLAGGYVVCERRVGPSGELFHSLNGDPRDYVKPDVVLDH